MSDNPHKTIKSLPISVSKVILPLSYTYAEPGDLLFQIGDKVNFNQALTKLYPNNPYSIILHAPITGTISNIDYYPTLQTLANIDDFKQTLCIEITKNLKKSHAPDCQDDQNHHSDDDAILPPHVENPISQNKNNTFNKDNYSDFITTLNQAGIVGLGGAGFPTGYKISNNANTIIINAMECEPPITVDNCLIINYSDQVLAGCNLLNNILQPQEIIIAIKESMTDAISSIKMAMNNLATNIKLVVLPNNYPSGYSKTLIKLITRKEIKYNVHSNDYGIICLNVGTIYAIAQAINYQQPLTHRIITITGENLKSPGNYQIAIGTTINTILKSFDIDLQSIKNNTHSLYVKVGGDYMGVEIFNSDHQAYRENIDLLDQVGIEKTTQSLIINYQKKNSSIKNSIEPIQLIQPCIKCGFCADSCPMNLLPQQLYWFKNNEEQLEQHNINACIECGLCDTVCPSNIPLTGVFKNLKGSMRINKYQQYKADHAATRHALTQQRAEEEKARLHAKKDSTHKNLLQAALERAKGKNNS